MSFLKPRGRERAIEQNSIRDRVWRRVIEDRPLFDGLTSEELNRLKRHLKRIILVSHQEEFTDHFPVVIQLQRTDEGVTATTVRR